MRAFLAALVVVVALSGCLSYDTFPPCDAHAPRHLSIHIPAMAEDDGDAAVVAQSANLQGWTNVQVHRHVWKGSDIEADCNLEATDVQQ